jgi:uncharacterized Zn finger protein
MPEYQPISSTNLSDIGQRCPKCHQPRMILAKIESGPIGSEYRTFECQKCGRVHTLIVPSDPTETDIRGDFDSELTPPM